MIIETTGVMPRARGRLQHGAVRRPVADVRHFHRQARQLPFYQLYFKELALIKAAWPRAKTIRTRSTLVERGRFGWGRSSATSCRWANLQNAMGMLGSDDGQRMKIILEHA